MDAVPVEAGAGEDEVLDAVAVVGRPVQRGGQPAGGTSAQAGSGSAASQGPVPSTL
ncbi:hypothetical protein [Actinomadura sp. 21ATH]|uniref:hypothetical protein n=1 Tax=Actinomadura sp. 21ATH TaxID=1735444 RepID=UPI0035C215AA